MDKHSNLHLIIGKASFSETQLVDNYAAVLDEVLRAKPSAAKGKYLKKVTLTTTMGPGVPVDPNVVKNLQEDRPTPESTSLRRGAATTVAAPRRVSAVAGSGGMRFEDVWFRYAPARPVGAARRRRRGSTRARWRSCSAATASASRPCSSWPPGCCGRCRGRVGDRPGASSAGCRSGSPPTSRSPSTRYLTGMAAVAGLGRRAADGRSTAWTDRLGLAAFRAVRLPELSKGTAQKVGLAQALLRPPGLLVLDEPWEGLDAATRELVPELIAEVLGRRRVRPGQRPPRRDGPAAGRAPLDGRRRPPR